MKIFSIFDAHDKYYIGEVFQFDFAFHPPHDGWGFETKTEQIIPL